MPSQSRLPPCQLPQRGSQVGALPKVCRKPSLASLFGGRWSPVGTVQDRPSRQARRSLPLVLIERIAHVRGGCTPGNSRPGQLAAARAHQENSARARGLHPRQFAPWGGELRSRLCEPLARVRAGGGLPSRTPFKHRKGHPSWFGCPFCLGRKKLFRFTFHPAAAVL